jgi:predicted transcriptional regulator
MEMTKILVNEAIKEMPNEFSIDELIEKLILMQSFEQGREQLQTGKVFSHQEVGQKLEKWLK